MGLLDFLNVPKWKEAEIDFPRQKSIKAMEEDYWWIDKSEPTVQKVCLDEFYNQCLGVFTKTAQEANLLQGNLVCTELLPVGKKVVFEYLYDRYLVQRHESDPDIFYDYVVQLSFEAGITIANKWKDASADLEEYIDKIIRETSFDDIRGIYQQYFNVESEQTWRKFISNLSAPVYDLLKWYHEQDNFEAYKLKLLLAAFQLGMMLILNKRQ